MSRISLWLCITAGKFHPKLASVPRCVFCTPQWLRPCVPLLPEAAQRSGFKSESGINRFRISLFRRRMVQLIWDLHAVLYFKLEKFQPCVLHPRGPSGGTTCSISGKNTASQRKCCSTAAWCGASSAGPPPTPKVEQKTQKTRRSRCLSWVD